jgi:hypothetical protein
MVVSKTATLQRDVVWISRSWLLFCAMLGLRLPTTLQAGISRQHRCAQQRHCAALSTLIEAQVGPSMWLVHYVIVTPWWWHSSIWGGAV